MCGFKMGNDSAKLRTAQERDADEFYTQEPTILKEIDDHYTPYFENKIIYCNCDNPKFSKFIKVFKEHFKEWGLKELWATYYVPQKQTTLFDFNTVKADERPYWYRYDGKDETYSKLKGNGSYDSPECIELLHKCDIVITNPPFSKMQSFILFLFKHKKQFLLIGTLFGMTYKNVSDYVKSGKLWLGHSIHSGGTKFDLPEYYWSNNTDHTGIVNNIRWITNFGEREIAVLGYR